MSAAAGDPRRVFWSGVRSQSHVVYAASWLRRLLAETTGPVTLVDLGAGSFLGRRAVDAEDLARLLPADPRLTRVPPDTLRAHRSERLTYLAVGAPGLKPWARLRAANPGARLDVVVTDEGLGSYGTWRTRRDAWLREGGSGLSPTVRAVAVTAGRRLLTTERWALYRSDPDGGWSVHEPVAAEFRRQVGEPPTSSAAVFLTQPWVELGLVSEDAYVHHVGRIGASCDEAGFAFAVRPHPVEDAARYAGWPVWGGPKPAELDPRIAGAGVILGETSSALVNLAAVFGRRAVRVRSPGLAAIEEGLGPEQASLLRRWVGEAVEDTAVLQRLEAG